MHYSACQKKNNSEKMNCCKKCSGVPIGKSSDGQEQYKSNIKFGRGGTWSEAVKPLPIGRKWGILNNK